MNQPIKYAEIRALIDRKMYRCARYEAEGDDVATLLCDGHGLPRFTLGPLGSGNGNGYGSANSFGLGGGGGGIGGSISGYGCGNGNFYGDAK